MILLRRNGRPGPELRQWRKIDGEFVSGVTTDDGHEPRSERVPASRSPTVGEGQGDAALAERYGRPVEGQP